MWRPGAWALWGAALLAAVTFGGGGAAADEPADGARVRPVGPWAVYYSDSLPVTAFDPYDLLVLDSAHHPPLRPLVDRGKTLLGYISLGEVETHRPWFAEVEADGLLGEENPNWPGSYYVDVRDPRWVERVVSEIVPDILRKGFHGVFLDTLDNPLYLEEQDPKRWAGMTEAAATLVRAIRYNYPTIPIMMNRAYALLPRVGAQIDMVMGESVAADYDFEAKTYRRVPAVEREHQVLLLRDAQKRFPHLQVMTLDYWSPDDPKGIAALYALQRANGFNPSVSVVELDRLVAEPTP